METMNAPKRALVGYDNFVRHNPMTDKFDVQRFDHIEYYCGDALTTYNRFRWGLGMNLVAKSDQSTGNQLYASYVCQSGEVKFIFTSPYGPPLEGVPIKTPHPNYSQSQAHQFFQHHGLAVRAIGIRVADATIAYNNCVSSGAKGVTAPQILLDDRSGEELVMSEIWAYGDVVLRFVSGNFNGSFLPNYEPLQVTKRLDFGMIRVDHIVGNVPSLFETTDYIMSSTGFHEFAEFVASDVGTLDSGLNSMVIASNNEMILMPINEPTFGTPRKSQIQTYLEMNGGAGVQHIAILTCDIFTTVQEMRQRTDFGGFDFMPAPSGQYYANLPNRIGDVLSPEQYKRVEELGLLADKDDQGTLLQIFTKPLGDRMTIFIEIIQRIGCDKDELGKQIEQKAGCGGFGKGNFSELFKSIEEYEKLLDGSAARATGM